MSKKNKSKKMDVSLDPAVLMRTFVDGLDSYPIAFHRIQAAAKLNHPSLFKIVEIGREEKLKERQELADAVGLPSFRQMRYHASDNAYINQSGPSDGGVAVGFKDDQEVLRTVIFLRRDPTLASDLQRYRYPVLIAAFFHELGHVDDLERGLHLIEGKNIDLVAAELHAHLFCAAWLIKENFVISAKAYVEGITQHLTSKSISTRRAAESFLSSSVGQQLCDFSEKGIDLALAEAKIKHKHMALAASTRLASD